jgi:O-antigen/teichoic acid export membrane protein
MLTYSKPLKIFFAKEGKDRLRHRFARAATGTFGLKIFFTCLLMIINIILARILDVTGYGAYTYTMAWIGLLSIPAQFGLDRLLVRNIATYQTQAAWGLMKGMLRWSDHVVLIVSISIALLTAGVAWVLIARFHMQTLSALWIALFMLPLISLTDVRCAAMQGLHHVVVGRMPEMLLRPLSFLAFIGCAYLLLGKGLSVDWAVAMYAMAVGVSFLVGAQLLHNKLPQPAKDAIPAYQTSAWIRSALPLVLLSSMHVINHRVDTLMLGAMAGAEAVGIYNVVLRGTQLILFIQDATNVVLGPTIASIYASGNMLQLQRVIAKSARVVLLISLFFAIALVVFGNTYLSLFGPAFRQGYHALAILVIGKTLNAAAGPVNVILLMTKYERDAAVGIGATAVLSVVLNAVLIPKWGIEGAAIATTTSMIVRNLSLALWIYWKMGIHSTALGRVRLFRKA